jgi:hypothetical protein
LRLSSNVTAKRLRDWRITGYTRGNDAYAWT